MKEAKIVERGSITLSKFNQRHAHPDDPNIIELAETIRAKGILEPLIVRERSAGDGYELLAGERRFIAAAVAGLDEIPVIVKQCNDQEAMEITVIENMQREDLTPLQEARGIRELMAEGKDVQAIAANLGKSPAWVLRRARLSDLIPEWVAAFEDPKTKFFHWSAGHMELIARFDAKTQGRMLKDLCNYSTRVETTVAELEHALGAYLHQLNKAKWALDDDVLVPRAGSCQACTKRSACNPGLFGPIDAPSEDDYCLDDKCWARKEAAYLEKREATLASKHPGLCKISDSYTGKKDVLSSYQYEPAKKSDKGAIPAMVVDGTDAGALRYIKPSGNTQVHPAAPTLEQLEDEFAQLRRLALRELVCSEIEKAERPERFGVNEETFKLLVFIGCQAGFDDMDMGNHHAFFEFIKEKPMDEVLAATWDVFKVFVMEDLLSEWLTRDNEAQFITALKKVCEYFSLDGKALKKQADASVQVPDDLQAMREKKPAKSKKSRAAK